ncbi:MAG: glycosyltransferase [Bacteroidales bacterium]|nr:glycosyltransferase [Bacteroidales bacterium]
MKKLAVIFESSPFDRKGLFNAVHERVRHLVASGEFEVDAYCIHSWDTAFTRRMRHTPEVAEKVDRVDVAGVEYRMLWYDFSVVDHILVEKLHVNPFFFAGFLNAHVSLLEGYDAVIAHSFTGGLFALRARELYGLPYFVSWHGSDVHTHPWRNPLILYKTREVMDKAERNFFVSHALLEESGKITSVASKDVLYNGVSEDFFMFPEMSRSEHRRNFGVTEDEKVVAFVGSIVDVKNVKMLQPLFHEIRARYQGALKFWMVGDGKMRSVVEPELMSDDSIDVRMWGNVPSDKMPAVMNSIDVLVLPSRNEGLPLVCAEAIRCGANVIGADVGGVSEIIGKDYVIPHGECFIESMAVKVAGLLASREEQVVPESMSWEKTAEKEKSFINAF